MRTLALAAVLFAAACGPKSLAGEPPPARPSDEPWVKDHIATVKAACECTDSPCLTSAKAKLDALEAEHGGLDESPADVHESRGRFEECYRSGTIDPVRDFELLVNELCNCNKAQCVDKSRISRLRFEDKYATTPKTAEQSRQLGALSAKFAGCQRDKTVDAAVIIAHMERVTLAVCECASGTSCGIELTSLPDFPSAPKVTNVAAIGDRMKVAIDTFCICVKNASMTGSYGGMSTARCPKDE